MSFAFSFARGEYFFFFFWRDEDYLVETVIDFWVVKLGRSDDYDGDDGDGDDWKGIWVEVVGRR